jgi:hypothetical protein
MPNCARCVGQHLALLEQRRHQAVGDATVRRAFAHRVDARVGHGLHRVADDDACGCVDMQAAWIASRCWAGCPRPSPPGPPGSRVAVLELHGPDTTPGRGLPIGPSRLPSCRRSALRLRAHQECIPRSSRDFCSSLPATSSSWRSISHGMTCTTLTCMPRFIRPLAASRPSRPPPMTTACLYWWPHRSWLGVGDVAVSRARLAGPCQAPAV